MPKVTVDGAEIEVPAGAIVLQARPLAQHAKVKAILAALVILVSAPGSKVAAQSNGSRAVPNFVECVMRQEGQNVERALVANPRPKAFATWIEQHSSKCGDVTAIDGGSSPEVQRPDLRYALAEAVFRKEFRSDPAIRSTEDLFAIPPLAGPKGRDNSSLDAVAECVIRADPDGSFELLSSEAGSSGEERAFSQISRPLAICGKNSPSTADDLERLRGALAFDYIRLADARPQQIFLKPGLKP